MRAQVVTWIQFISTFHPDEHFLLQNIILACFVAIVTACSCFGICCLFHKNYFLLSQEIFTLFAIFGAIDFILFMLEI